MSQGWAASGLPGSVMAPKPIARVLILTAIATLLNQSDSR
jgi:hypothetical protein